MISLQQTYKDKWMMRERVNKEKVKRKNDKRVTVASRPRLKSSSFTYELRSAILFYIFEDIALFFSGAEGKHVS